MKEIIKKLMTEIDKEVKLIGDYVTNRNHNYQSNVFEAPKIISTDLSNDEIIKETERLRGKKGVYVFITIHDFEFDKNRIHNWDQCSGAKVNSQDPSGNMYPFSVKKGEIFYIGSCYSNSLLTRIRKHCNQKEDVQESSLKLSNQNRIWAKSYLQVYCFPIKPLFDKTELHLIIPEFEKQLHNRFRAIIGSNRT